MVRAYAWPAAWILAGFVLAEILQRVAVSTGTHWPAVVAVWLSLLALLAGTARALRVTWRFWRARPAAPTNRNED
jgi:hypothetical protein